MLINTFDCGPRNTKILEEAARFFAAQLMDPRMVRNIEIDLEIVNKLDVQGECISEDDCKNPRYFTIRLRKQKLDEMVKTLAHEMVHVKQYAKNELSKQMRLSRGGLGVGSKWHGEWWNPKAKEDDYWDSPWEIEAYGREVGLHHKWVARKEK
jgi:hypothetical protein